jgi:hypothetical protein
VNERAKRLFEKAEDSMAERMREIHERGELRHLQGRPLHLEDDDPAWLVTRMLKQEGFSHPLLEQRQAVEAQIRAAASILERLARRREWLMHPEAHATREQALGFNEGRCLALDEYRGRLAELNRAIRDYNITVPMELHVKPMQLDREIDRAGRSVPPLEAGSFPETAASRSVWSRILRDRRHE